MVEREPGDLGDHGAVGVEQGVVVVEVGDGRGSPGERCSLALVGGLTVGVDQVVVRGPSRG